MGGHLNRGALEVSPDFGNMQTRKDTPTVALLMLAFACMPTSAQPWGVAELRAFSGLTVDQWKAVTLGDPQARVLDTKEKREVAVVGVAYLRANTTCFTTMLQDIENFKKSQAVLQIRKFWKPVDNRVSRDSVSKSPTSTG